MNEDGRELGLSAVSTLVGGRRHTPSYRNSLSMKFTDSCLKLLFIILSIQLLESACSSVGWLVLSSENTYQPHHRYMHHTFMHASGSKTFMQLKGPALSVPVASSSPTYLPTCCKMCLCWNPRELL